MSSKVLITGGTGFVGIYIVHQLAAAGYDLSVLLRKESKTAQDILSIHPNIKMIYGDLTDLNSLDIACAGQDIVIHVAAMVSFDPAMRKAMYKTNVNGTTNLVNACLSSSVKKLIYISSIAAISDLPDSPNHDETIPWDIKTNHSDYAISKHAAEMEVWRGSAEGLEVGILNPSVVLGRYEEGHHAMKIFNMVRDGLAFYPTGSTGWVDVRDVALAVLAYIEKGLFNQQFIINGCNTAYRDVMNKIAIAYKKKLPQYALHRSIAIPTIRFYSLFSGLFKKYQPTQISIVKSLFKHNQYDNSLSVNELGLAYRSLDETIQWVTSQQGPWRLKL